MTTETLFSPSTIRLFGRVVEGLAIQPADRAGSQVASTGEHRIAEVVGNRLVLDKV